MKFDIWSASDMSYDPLNYSKTIGEIEINTLEELLKIKDVKNERIIITDGEKNEYGILIYDDYIE